MNLAGALARVDMLLRLRADNTAMTPLALIAVLLCALCNLWLHGKANQVAAQVAAAQAPDARATQPTPNPRTARWLSMGFTSLLADWYWLRAINHFGDGRMHAVNYPHLLPLMRQVLALDPYFAGAYIFSGTALTLNGMDFSASAELLDQGTKYRPEIWRIPFLLGFNSYYYLHDYSRAAHALAQAARLPGAPPFIAPLATRLAAQGRVPQVGIDMIEALLGTPLDVAVRTQLEERRRLLHLEVQLQELQVSVDAHRVNPHTPLQWSDLVASGALPSVPYDPWGQPYRLQHNRVVSSHEDARLRLPLSAGVADASH